MLDIIVILINNMLVYATPLIFAALGGVFSERSGVVNIGLEGMMIIGAFGGALGTIWFGQEAQAGSFAAAAAPWIGIAVAALFGLLLAIPHAVASIHFKADQVVSGVAINFLALGVSVYFVKQIYNAAQTPAVAQLIHKQAIPLLSSIPVVGQAFFVLYPTTILALLFVALAYYILYKTPFGLRLRAVGEHPAAADTNGINVYKMRYIAVLISGMLAGIGGAVQSLAIAGNYQYGTISGQGFMALAAMIFGKWHPVGAMLAALFFGLAQAISALSQTIGLNAYIPNDFINMFPYVVTILALAGLVGKTNAPAADGKPYEKGSR
ncbi:ABC transporter permease [Aneurinibacillus tyrosinisolvens]|uniref:ABC transporter permease n=1 Tax=Aneurinibacillus tyrosinisolvens TaxID=1443435 RepID=UPI00063F2BB5|nr:ABC transporter permease [Aneurinibacillus tyrosinisolvens]